MRRFLVVSGSSIVAALIVGLLAGAVAAMIFYDYLFGPAHIDLIGDGMTVLHTVLHIAIREGSLATIRLLLDNGADPNKSTRTGNFPLSMVRTGRAMAGDDDEKQVVELLVHFDATSR